MLADNERRGDLAVRLAGGDEPQHLELARRQPVLALRRRLEPHEIRLGAEPLEDLPRCVVLQGCRLVVSEQVAGVSDQHACPCDLVGSVERTPRLPGRPQRDERLARLTLREVHRAASVGDDRSQHRALVASRDLLELQARTPRGLDLARREHDLDERGKEARAVERRRRGRLRATDRRDRGVGPSLRETELREPRLRLPPVGACLAVRALGAREVTLQAQELALPVAREPGGAIPGLDEPLSSAARLLERLSPRAVELHDLRAVHGAAARERDHLRL